MSIGSLTQEDPIGLAGGLNLYGFAGGDPVNFSDPFGLCPWHDIECLEDKLWAATGGTGFSGHVLAPLASLILDLSGAIAVDEHSKAAAAGSGTGAALLAADIVLAAIPGGEEGGQAIKRGAEELAEKIGSNSVSRRLADGGVERIDLVGRAHGGVETPHVHTYKLHTNPETGASRLSKTGKPRPATQADLENARQAVDQ